MPAYKCAICAREVPYEGKLPDLYPFCSARCKWVDFGKWLHEAYTIDRELTPDEVADHRRSPRDPPAES
jgi:endogenous inhibitor of DNA gyrase (YacG/DUF329 family)